MICIDQYFEKINNEAIKEFLKKLLEYYFSPSFSSTKQREFDIFLFSLLKEYGFFDNKDPSLFEVISKLQVTRNKAKNLIYESNLRFNKDNLDEKVKEELKHA